MPVGSRSLFSTRGIGRQLGACHWERPTWLGWACYHGGRPRCCPGIYVTDGSGISVWGMLWRGCSCHGAQVLSWPSLVMLLRLGCVITCRKLGSSGTASWPKETPSTPTCGLSITTWKGEDAGWGGSAVSGGTCLTSAGSGLLLSGHLLPSSCLSQWWAGLGNQA